MSEFKDRSDQFDTHPFYQSIMTPYESTMEARIKDAAQGPGAPSNRQVGGDHYKNFPIQPGEFIYKNGLNWFEGNAVKYICRHKVKNGKEDIQKAIHYLELLLEKEYGNNG